LNNDTIDSPLVRALLDRCLTCLIKIGPGVHQNETAPAAPLRVEIGNGWVPEHDEACILAQRLLERDGGSKLSAGHRLSGGIVRLKKTDSESHSARVAHGTDCEGERR
jgi:hypothetical protein